jgi:hypothetical protein
MRATRNAGAIALLAALLVAPAAGLGLSQAPPARLVQQAGAALTAQPYRAELRLVLHVSARGGSAAARRGFPAAGLGERLRGELVAEGPRRFMERLSGSIPLGTLTLVGYDGATYVSHDGTHYYLVSGELRRFFAALETQADALAPQGTAGLRQLAGLRLLAPRIDSGVAFAHYGGPLPLGAASQVLGPALGRAGIPPQIVRSLSGAVSFTNGRQDYWVAPQGVLVRQQSNFGATFDLGAIARRLGGQEARALRGVRLVLRGASVIQVVELGQPVTLVRPAAVGRISTLRQLILR